MPDDDKKPKKPRFKERDDADDDADDDRPRKKKRADDDADDDDVPKKKKRRDDDDVDEDDDRPKKKKKRVAADDGPRVEGSERTPVLMMVALLGSALALLACCVGGGWYSWMVLVTGGDFGGNEFEVVGANRQDENRRDSTPTITWSLVTLRPVEPKGYRYYVVMRTTDGKTGETDITDRYFKGTSVSKTIRYPDLKGTSGATEVYVERRGGGGSPVKVSNSHLAR